MSICSAYRTAEHMKAVDELRDQIAREDARPLYVSKGQFQSIQEADAFRGARSEGLLPGDAWTESTDEGHHIAFFSRDAEACAAINEKIAKMRRDPQIAGTPQIPTRFAGWVKVK